MDNVAFQLILSGLPTFTGTGNYTITNQGGVIVNKASGAATTVNLPKVVAGKPVVLFIVDGKGDAASNNITIDPYSSQTINGASTLVLSENYGAVMLVSNGTEWNIAASFGANAALLSGLTATVAELNRSADTSGKIVNCTASTLVVTEALHDQKLIVLDRAAGIAVTLPVAAPGLDFEFVVKTTFTGAASIKSVAGTDIMIGNALMGNDSDNTIVRWPAVAADTFDTIDLLGTGNSTGGMAGQRIRIRGLAAALWFVEINGDAAGTEATPFANTVA